MRILVMIVGILLFALVTAILMLWGMRKAYFQKERLANMLFSKASDKVMNYLKTHDTITEKEMRSLVEGIQAREFMSRNSAVVQADKRFTEKLTELMCADGLIEQAVQGKPVYKQKNKEGK